MENDVESFFALAEALGIGLLIGIEREQNAQAGDKVASAGVRSFSLAALIGALSMMAGGVPLLAVAVIAVAVTRLVSVAQRGDPTTGLTTSFALVAVVVLGAMATVTAMLAAAVALVIASLLAAREVLHGFSRQILTPPELRDGLILGVSALVILPVLPNVDIGPGGALNPRNLFLMVVLVMLIGAAGHVATRVVGVRLGLPVSGFLSGFVSSLATIATLGKRAGEKPEEATSAATGATLSSVSSLAQNGIILAALSPSMLGTGLPLLVGMGLMAAGIGALMFFRTLGGELKPAKMELPNRVFSVWGAVRFAAIVATVMVFSATLNDIFGNAAILVTIALAGLVSTNSAVVALGSLVAAGQIPAIDGTLPLAAALTANTLVRIWVARSSADKSFQRAVIWGLIAQLVALWAAWWIGGVVWDWLVDTAEELVE